LTAVVTAGVLAGFVLQSAKPEVLPLLKRDPALVTEGQLWRAVTALFVQDGGVRGLALNVTCLILIGVTAERRWGASKWLIAYFGGGVLTEFLALRWGSSGAGNSVAFFALAGALTTHIGSKLGPVQLTFRAIALCAGGALLIRRDIHGLAYGAGAFLGLAFTIADRHFAAAPPSSNTR
jgi:membrane associated rhomboid family serine protease